MKLNRSFSISISLGLILGALAFQSCKKSSAPLVSGAAGGASTNTADVPDKGPVKNDWMVTSLPANPSTLNPVLSTDAYAPPVTSNVFDTLVTWNYLTAKPEGKLAESWKVSPDGLTYEFKLRKNILFHDGKPLTSEDVKFSFDMIQDPKVDAATLRSYLSGLASVEAKTPDTIIFHMKNAYYRNLIMLGDTQIMPKHIYGVGDFNTNAANRVPVGSGPYQFVKWDTGRLIELKRFPQFWGLQVPEYKDRYNFNEILFRIITEPAVTVLALKKGEIDEIPEVTTTQWLKDFGDPASAKEFNKLEYSTQDGSGISYIGWNEKNSKFASAKVRRALALLMPRDEINKKLYEGLRSLSVGMFPPKSPKSDPALKPLPYDPRQAKELLAAEGWVPDASGNLVKGGEKFAFELLFTAGNPDAEKMALIYQQSLRDAGIEMNIRTLEWTVYLKQMTGHKFDAMMGGWGSSLDEDPYQIWHSSQSEGGGSNHISYKNEKVDELLTKARVTLDETKRNEMYQEFSRILADDAPYVFLFERPSYYVGTKRFKGVQVGKLGINSDFWYTPIGAEKYKGTP